MTTQIIMTARDGHFYAAIGLPNAMTWAGADSFVQTGLEIGTTDWHLATVATASENHVLRTLLDHTQAFYAFFGLVQAPGSFEPTGGRGWNSGETLTYKHWFRGEPNDMNQGHGHFEGFGVMYGPQSGAGYSGFWNDFSAVGKGGFALAELDVMRALTLSGGKLTDRLFGGDFGDHLSGLGGKDVINGGLGDDLLSGGNGQDRLTGGGGVDTFVFDNLAGTDTITDFEIGVDQIDLTLIDADLNTVEDDSFRFVGTDAFDGHAGQLRFGATLDGRTLLEGDIDGNGTADFQLMLLGTLSLSQTDFLL